MKKKVNTFFLDAFRGDWGFVTGASSGIGRAYAERLASAGMNLVLIARGRDRLRLAAQELEDRYGIQTHVLSLDLSVPGCVPILKQFVDERGLRIRFLCHAAGSSFWGRFIDGEASLYAGMVEVHVTTIIDLMLSFHDDLASHQTSAAVIVSSRAGHHPLPNMAVYGAVKAFSCSLSQALFSEWEKEGIQVQALMPGAVDTNLFENRRLLAEGVIKKTDLQSPQQVVEQSVRGLQRHVPKLFTGTGVWFQRICFTLFPAEIFLRAVYKNFIRRSPPTPIHRTVIEEALNSKKYADVERVLR